MKKLSSWFKRLPKIAKKTLTRNNIIIGVSVIVLFFAIILIWVSTWQLPTLDSFEERKVAQSTKIYDSTGEILLYDVFQNVKRTVVPFEDISDNVKKGVLAIEDKDFYSHNGVKPLSFMRAVFVNIFSLSYSQGGSTITQQAVKNSLLTNEKRLSRKIKEWVLAIKLEKIMTKDQIFSMYLNEIPFGGTLYGVEEASQAFFGKSSKDVTIAEAAYLAAIPKAPTYYSPYGKNKADLDARKNLVLREMKEDHFITEAQYDVAMQEEVTFQPKPEIGIKAPHFVMYVINELEKKFGGRVLEEGGLRVITTLNYELQEKAETFGKEYALENEKSSDAENIALVALDPTTGGILSMVGSRDYFDKEIDGNFNVALAHRQPGSAFKPFAYAQAFLKGYTPNTVLFDTETEFSTSCTPEGTPKTSDAVCYKPVNYDSIYRGPVTMRNALAQSINIPAIKTLYLAGMRDTLRLAKDMGINSLTNTDQYGLTLVLGGGEVSLLDITSAYGVFANGGVRNPYYAINEIKDITGTVIERYDGVSSQVLDKNVALQISDILSDESARIPAFGANSPLNFPNRDVAVKTGTTNDYHDAWIVGYTPHIAIGAWAGNNDNSPMQKQVARYIIAPYWNMVMNEALKIVPDETFEQPVIENSYELKPVLRGNWQGGNSILIDTKTGKMINESTPLDRIGEKITGGVHTILHWVDTDDPRGPAPQNPRNDPQYESWEYGVRNWVQRNNISENNNDNVQIQESDLIFEIISPQHNAEYPENQTIVAGVEISSTYPITKVEYFINNKLIASPTKTPFTASFIPKNISGIKSTNTLKVIVHDSQNNKETKEIKFKVD